MIFGKKVIEHKKVYLDFLDILTEIFKFNEEFCEKGHNCKLVFM